MKATAQLQERHSCDAVGPAAGRDGGTVLFRPPYHPDLGRRIILISAAGS
jgi:hypothetical protein